MPLAAAVVGTGFIGPVHVEALRRLGIPVRGVLGSNPQKSIAAARSMRLDRGYESFAQLLDDPLVDVVHIASPNRWHFEQCRAALIAGKHVVCEKPLAMTSKQSEELVRLSAERPRQLAAVCHNIRYYPLNQEAKTRLPALGKVHHISGSYVQDWLLNDSDFNWRILSAEGGPLRAVADIGTHWIDLVQHVAGLKIESVCADLATCIPVRQAQSAETFSQKTNLHDEPQPVRIDTEDTGNVLLRFANGATGVFHVSQVTAGRKNCLRYEISAATGSMAWNSERPDELWIGRRERINESLLRDPSLLSTSARAYSDFPGGHAEGFPDSFKQLFKATYQCLDNVTIGLPSAYPTFADGHREMLLCDAILRSHRERRWIDVAE
jgi:predicted dehydrogenase